MNSEFFDALDLIEREKHIPKSYMLEKIQAALTSAFKHEFGNNTNIKVEINEAKKDIKVYSVRKVVADSIVPYDPVTQIKISEAKEIKRRKKFKVGDDFCEEVKTKDFGRVSAQTAKQVIIQGIREAERKRITTEYETKKEEIISGEVVKIDNVTGDVTLDIKKDLAVLPKSEQIPGEEFEIGQIVKVYVAQVNKDDKEQVALLSRTHKKFVSRLIELETPEIQEGIVVIRAVAREAGSRTKIAVETRNSDIDPVGACIGSNGTRIAVISKELKGEKIDVVPYSDVTERYVKAALAPAYIKSVVKIDDKNYKVIVEESQYSLAIGKDAQNVRLAARLIGVRIDIKTE